MTATDDARGGPLRCGFVAILGAPNAGKSTLLNNLVGAKVSIVTRKVQTTRARLRGIAVAGACQIIFVDTPGIFAPKRRLERAMVAAAWSGARDADVVALVFDAGRKAIDPDSRIILDGLKDILKDRDRRAFGFRAMPLESLIANAIKHGVETSTIEGAVDIHASAGLNDRAVDYVIGAGLATRW